MSIKERTDWFYFPAVGPVEMLRPETWRATCQAGWQKQSKFRWHRGGLPHFKHLEEWNLSWRSQSCVHSLSAILSNLPWRYFISGHLPHSEKLNIILTFPKHPDIIWPESFSQGHLGALSFSTGTSCLVILPGCPTCNPQASWSPGQL